MSERDPVLANPADSNAEDAFALSATAPSRPRWSGLLHVGLLAIPVKAYPALLSAPKLPVHLLHAGGDRRLCARTAGRAAGAGGCHAARTTSFRG